MSTRPARRLGTTWPAVRGSRETLERARASISLSRCAEPGGVAWGKLGVDVVLECTGRFRTPETLVPYFVQGVAKVVVAAPVKSAGALNIVMGVNDDRYDSDVHDVVTAASCTTNCLAPVVKAIHEGIGIRHGLITTL